MTLTKPTKEPVAEQSADPERFWVTQKRDGGHVAVVRVKGQPRAIYGPMEGMAAIASAIFAVVAALDDIQRSLDRSRR